MKTKFFFKCESGVCRPRDVLEIYDLGDGDFEIGGTFLEKETVQKLTMLFLDRMYKKTPLPKNRKLMKAKK